MWKLLGLGAITISTYHPQANDQTECINCTIGQILHKNLLDKHQKYCPVYMAFTEMAINSNINASIKKAPFEVLYGENIPLPVDLLLSRESSINPHILSLVER